MQKKKNRILCLLEERRRRVAGGGAAEERRPVAEKPGRGSERGQSRQPALISRLVLVAESERPAEAVEVVDRHVAHEQRLLGFEEEAGAARRVPAGVDRPDPRL